MTQSKLDQNREVGLKRLTLKDISPWNQYYINTYFIFRDVQYAAERYASGHLLDVGCGNKPYLEIFDNRVASYVGCDVIQSNENVVDRICPANDLSFDNETFETVFSTQVMEHVADFHGMVAECFRVLKNNGYGIFTIPFCWELHEEPYDFFRFTKYGLKELFKKYNFEIVEIKSNGGKWAALFQTAINIFFSTRKYKTFRSRIIKLIFIHFRFLYVYNRFAVWLDKKYFDDKLTLNYLVVVRKNALSKTQ